jgi:L-aminopeptidase/D-esterase-like protein
MSFIPWPDIDPLYAAVVQSVEEAVVNALVAGEEMVGWKGHRVPAMPIDVVTDLLRQHGRLL